MHLVGPSSLAGASARAMILLSVATLTLASLVSPEFMLVRPTLTEVGDNLFPNPFPLISSDKGIAFFSPPARAASFSNWIFVTIGLDTFRLTVRLRTLADTVGNT